MASNEEKKRKKSAHNKAWWAALPNKREYNRIRFEKKQLKVRTEEEKAARREKWKLAKRAERQALTEEEKAVMREREKQRRLAQKAGLKLAKSEENIEILASDWGEGSTEEMSSNEGKYLTEEEKAARRREKWKLQKRAQRGGLKRSEENIKILPSDWGEGSTEAVSSSEGQCLTEEKAIRRREKWKLQKRNQRRGWKIVKRGENIEILVEEESKEEMSSQGQCLTCGEGPSYPLRRGLIQRLEAILRGTLTIQEKTHLESVCLCKNCKTKLEKIDLLVNDLRAVHRRKQARQAARRVLMATASHTRTHNTCTDSVDDKDVDMEIVEESQTPKSMVKHEARRASMVATTTSGTCTDSVDDKDVVMEMVNGNKSMAQQVDGHVPAVTSTATQAFTSNEWTNSVNDNDGDMETVEEYEEYEVEIVHGPPLDEVNTETTSETPIVSPADNKCGCGETFIHHRQQEEHRNEYHAGFHPCHQPDCNLLFESHTQLVEHGVVHGFSCLHCSICAAAFLTQEKLTQHKARFHKGATPGLVATFSTIDTDALYAEEVYSAVVQGISIVSDDPLVQAATELEAREEPASNIDHGIMILSEDSAANSHHLISDHPCPICDATFKAEHYLIRHIDRYHWKKDPDTNYLTCTWCNLVCPGLKEILPHARSHREQMLRCESCTLVFEMKNQLNDHSFRVHETMGTYMNRSKEIKTLTCSTCGATAETKSLLCYHRLIAHNADTHLIIERPRYKYPCRYCELSYAVKKDLGKHEHTHFTEPIPDSDPKYDCLNCGATFTSEGALAQHTVTGNCVKAQEAETSNSTEGPSAHTAHSEQNFLEFPCPVCDTTYQNETRVLRHIQKAHWCTSNDGTGCVYSCTFCSLTYDDIASIALHARTHRKDLIPCKYCYMVFFMDHHLSYHNTEVHKGNKKPQPARKEQYKCKQCLTATDTKSLLSFHTLTEHDTPLCLDAQPAYSCNKCSMACSTSKLLFNHMMRVHPETAGYSSYYQCSMCNKKLQTKNGLAVHRKKCPMVTGRVRQIKRGRQLRPSVTCYICGKHFEGSKEHAPFRDHMMTHTGKWNYACSVCDAKFLTEAKYKNHMKIHNRPLKCTKCKKGFVSNWSLKLHVKKCQSENAKTCMCQVCDKDLKHKNALERHMYEVHHIGEYPSRAYNSFRRYKCKLCNQIVSHGMKYKHFAACHPGVKCHGSRLILLDKDGNPVIAPSKPKLSTQVWVVKDPPTFAVKTPKQIHYPANWPATMTTTQTVNPQTAANTTLATQTLNPQMSVATTPTKNRPTRMTSILTTPTLNIQRPAATAPTSQTLNPQTPVTSIPITEASEVEVESAQVNTPMQESNLPIDGETILKAALEAAKVPAQSLVLAAKPNQRLEAIPLGEEDAKLRTLLNAALKKPVKNAFVVKSKGPMATVPIHQLLNNERATVTKVEKAEIVPGQPVQYIITYKPNNPSANSSSPKDPSQNNPPQNNSDQNKSSQIPTPEKQIYPVLLLNKTDMK